MVARGVDTATWLQSAWRNRLQSFFLLLMMGAFLGLLGWLLWGGMGIFMLVGVGVIGVVFNPAISPRLVMRMYGARPIGRAEAPGLWAATEQLAGRAGLASVPVLYYVPSRVMNAFAVGSPDNSAVALSDGLLHQLDWRELAGVLAHEVSHVRSNDLWVMGLADLFSRATGLLSLLGQFLLLLNLPLILLAEVTIDWFAIALLVFAPHISMLAQFALSRTREYDADLNAVRLTGDPDGLSSALARIERIQGGWFERILLPGRRVPDPSLLRTHPRSDERIKRLQAVKPRESDFAIPGLTDGRGRIHLPGMPVGRKPRWHAGGLWH